MNLVAEIDQLEIKKLFQKFGQIKSIVDPKKELRKTFLKAARPLIADIKAKTPVGTGQLKKSIGVIPYLGARSGKLFVGVRKVKNVEKKRIFTTFYGAFLEFGTKKLKKEKYAFFFKAAEAAISKSLSVLKIDLANKINRLGNG